MKIDSTPGAYSCRGEPCRLGWTNHGETATITERVDLSLDLSAA